ncbi:hypothetical protein BGZ63DRAFT_426624 [Mariannaea sp. PMI_226]|nr:hypothetical protein BGZ63DRAFT_426624 [Mariannaea sp. PMI_226]
MKSPILLVVGLLLGSAAAAPRNMGNSNELDSKRDILARDSSKVVPPKHVGPVAISVPLPIPASKRALTLTNRDATQNAESSKSKGKTIKVGHVGAVTGTLPLSFVPPHFPWGQGKPPSVIVDTD